MHRTSWTPAALYRAVWRWHFYAGLVCAPVLLILAVTGAIYLFNDEINDALYPQLRLVPAVAQPVTPERMADAARAAFPAASVTRIDTPKAADRSAEVFVTPASGVPRRVFVDPGTGRVLGSYVYADTLVGFADITHGSLMLGPVGDAIVELAACWGFILIVTGLYLWWPRPGRTDGRLMPRWGLKGRAFWKEWHAAIGLWTAALALFLILTGLPWAGIWGDLLRRGTDFAGIGYPQAHRGHGSSPASSTLGETTDGAAPWTLEAEAAPHSEHAGPMGHTGPASSARVPIGLDRVAEIVAGRGMAAPYRLNLPRDGQGTYIVFTYPDRPQGQRTLYIDQYSGAVLDDIGFADYGVAAKAVELGVQIHMGNYFGRLNQIVMLIPCLGIVFLSLSGPYMWWRRRPKGRFAAPRALAEPRMRGLAAIVLALCVPFPLAGLSLLLVLIIDGLIRAVSVRKAGAGA